jgi:ABC-type Fe3+-hydroxamate transport system substrate-binding protein
MQRKTVTDQLGRTIQINYPPKIIISLVPSQTELLFDLGLDEEVVGITKFCIHPADQFKRRAKIGGTKQLNIEKIRSLKPDLIIGNKEENEQEQIALLMQEFPVWMSDIYDLKDALNMIKSIGELVGKETEAVLMANEMEASFAQIEWSFLGKSPKKAVYFIWKDPYMVAGEQTYIHEMLKYVGLENVIQQPRYPAISASEIKDLNPEVVLLSTEPYPFKEKHVQYFKELWPKAIVRLVDGEMFSWYGSRLLKAVPYFKSFGI